MSLLLSNTVFKWWVKSEVERTLSLHWNAHIIPTHANAPQLFKISDRKTPKANLLLHIIRASCFAVSFSLALNTTFVSSTNSNHYPSYLSWRGEDPTPCKFVQVEICKLSACLSEPLKKVFINTNLLEN